MNDTTIPLFEIEQALKSNDLELALSYCQKSLGQAPDNCLLWHYLGIIHARQKRNSDALGDFHQALALNPGYVDAYLSLGFLLFNLGKYDESFANYLTGFGYFTQCEAPVATVPRVVGGLLEAIFEERPRILSEYRVHLKHFGFLLSKHPLTLESELPFRDALDLVGRKRESPNIELLIHSALALFAFRNDTDVSWNERTFFCFVIPVIEIMTRHDKYHIALTLESFAYSYFIKRRETEENFRKSFRLIAPYFEHAGHKVRTELGNVPPTKKSGPVVPSVAFFFHSGSILAHTDVVLSTLDACARAGNNSFKYHFYVLDNKNDKLERILRNYGIEVTWISDYQSTLKNDIYVTLLFLRRLMQNDGVDAVIWVSLATLLPFAFAMQIAPIQIWWAMKYHSLVLDDIDAYFANGSFEENRDIDGHPWQIVHSSLIDLYDESLNAQAISIREQYGKNTIVMGTMGREEKIENEDFLETVCDLLDTHPNAVYLWTGKTESPIAKKYFSKRNVHTRCHYIGWTNTKLYAQVIDVYLDSFPFGGGHTIFQSWAAKTPAVMLLTRETRETGVPTHLLPALDELPHKPEIAKEIRSIFFDGSGEDFTMMCKSREEYFNKASRMLDDISYRSRVAEAGYQFVTRFMTNSELTAESFNTQLKRVFRQKGYLV